MTATKHTVEPDEDDVREFIQDYSDAKRLAPGRANDILEAALAEEVPAPPDPDVSSVREQFTGGTRAGVECVRQRSSRWPNGTEAMECNAV